MKVAVREMRWTIAAVTLLSLALPSGAQAQAKVNAQDTKPKAIALPAGSQDGLPAGMKMPSSPRVPTTFAELFAERDTRALQALAYMRCLQTTLRGVQTGLLGRVPRAWLMTCVQQGEEWRGVFSELTVEEPGIKVHAQFAVRGTGMAVRDPVDTARVAGLTRAMLRGVAAPMPGAGTHQYMPVPLPQKTFIEVWFVPVPSSPSTAVVGGDSLIQMSLDGTRELGHSRTTPPIRTLAVTTGTEYLLKSTEERIPLLSELMVAHMALSLSPDVRVRTYQMESIFTRGVTAVRHETR